MRCAAALAVLCAVLFMSFASPTAQTIDLIFESSEVCVINKVATYRIDVVLRDFDYAAYRELYPNASIALEYRVLLPATFPIMAVTSQNVYASVVIGTLFTGISQVLDNSAAVTFPPSPDGNGVVIAYFDLLVLKLQKSKYITIEPRDISYTTPILALFNGVGYEIVPAAGGEISVSVDGYQAGAPELFQGEDEWASEALICSNSGQTISDVGDRLVSLVMTLNSLGITELPSPYEGVPLTPLSLNDYLSTELAETFEDCRPHDDWEIIAIMELAEKVGIPLDYEWEELLAPIDLTTLESYICAGRPIVLRTISRFFPSNPDLQHYVVATGYDLVNDQLTLAINDPGTDAITTLADPAYSNTVKGYGTLVPADGSANSTELVMSVHSPPDLRVYITDPQGRTAYYDRSTGQRENAIPNSILTHYGIGDNDISDGIDKSTPPATRFWAREPEDGSYVVELVSDIGGSADIAFYGYDVEGNVNLSRFDGISLAPGVEESVSVEYISTGAPETGSISGIVTADCPDTSITLLGVTIDIFEAGTGSLLESVATSADGAYAVADLPAGSYIVTIVSPLGFVPQSDDVAVEVVGGGLATVDFSMACAETADHPFCVGYWKHQVAVATGGAGTAQVGAATLCGYLDLISEHFNSNIVNEVIVYVPPASGECSDKLLVAKSLLNLTGMVGIDVAARQHLMALLLNVAAGNLSLIQSVSEDGATVSQAITYCDYLIDDADVQNDETAKLIAESTNKDFEIAAGIIPLTTQNIMYSPERPAVLARGDVSIDGVFPNPSNPATRIAFSIARAGFVNLHIFDVAGRLVRVLVQEQRAAGNHVVEWNGKDARGSAAASGIYYAKLRSGDRTVTSKIILVR